MATDDPSVELPLTGGCLCGEVRFEVDQPLIGAEYCHCTRCQRRTGTAASVTALAASGSVRVTQGDDWIRAWDPGDGWPKLFCSNCGGALFCRNPEDQDQLGVRLGAFDEDPGVRPAFRQFVAYAAAWEPIPEDGLPRFPERRPA
jgi:hypothetical protein